MADELRAGGPGRHCRWVDIVGRNRIQLERVRQRLALPPRLVALSLSEHLRPAIVPVHPARFLVTYFTSPSPRYVFKRSPVFLWLGDDSIVTINAWAHGQGLLGASQGLRTTRDDMVSRVLEAAVASHGEVGWRLNDAFSGPDRDRNHFEWHRKERRLVRFGDLLDRQLQLVHAVRINNRTMRLVHQQLRGLREIARYADRKLRESGYCRVCTRTKIRDHRSMAVAGVPPRAAT